jgi:hypothetical protein
MGDNDKDPKVKALIESGAPLTEVVDAATAEALQRWFGLPSFESLPPPTPDDAEIAAVLERRAKAIAAVDPALVELLVRRHGSPDAMLQFKADLEVRVDPSCARTDYTMVDRTIAFSEPREVDIPAALQDDLRECTPQALLRDLHRAELAFDKVFELVDMAAEQRFDIVAVVNEAMAANWKLPALGGSPFHEGVRLMAEAAAIRRTPPTDIPRPNRRIQD